MRMAGSEGSVGRGVTGEWPPVASDPMRRVLDALESSYLDDERSDQLFEQLMARLAEEEARKRKAARWFRWIGMAVGTAVVGLGAALGAAHWLS
jgi:hypothetical protein